jgi:SynChlorMet cassette radical SAM/SPASM protein ScmF
MATETNVPEEGYPLQQIYFYITEGCNLKCRHCWIAPTFKSGEQPIQNLDLDLFKHIIREAKPMGLVSAKLTGGEPLIHPQINQFVDILNSEDIRLVMETNGVLCTREMADLIATSRNPFVSVSIDGSEAGTQEWIRGVRGCFEDTVEGIRNLVKAKIKPQLIMTLMRRNKRQIEDVVRLAESLGAGSVKFNIVQPTSRGDALHKSGETLLIEELVELGKWVENDLSKAYKIKLFFGHPAVFRPLSRIYGEQGVGFGACGIRGVIGVLANGNYALCGIGETMREMVFGKAGEDRLEDVWKNSPVLNDIRNGLPERLEGICSNCVMNKRCLGTCVAQNYYRTKDLWAPFWYCDAAHQAGLFPGSRMKNTVD